MKLKQFADRKADSLVAEIIGLKKRMGFRTWAQEVRRLIPVSELSSEGLWRRYEIETKDVWDSLKTIYRDAPHHALCMEAAKCREQVKGYGKVVDLCRVRERGIEMERD